jgi:hypothetical protein
MVIDDIDEKSKRVIDDGRNRFIQSFSTDEEKSIATLQMYPEIFITDIMGVNEGNGLSLTSQQKELLTAIGRLSFCKRARFDAERAGTLNYLPRPIRNYADHQGIVLQSARGCGKTAVMTLITFWFQSMFENAKIPILAPTERVGKGVFFAELNNWFRRRNEDGSYAMNNIFRDKVSLQATRMVFDNNPNQFAELRVSSKSTSEAEKKGILSGYHSDNMLIQVDESASIDSIVFEPLATTMTGKNNFIILAGNPISLSGYYYDCLTSPKVMPYYIKFKWSAEDCEIISKEYIKMMEKRYGRDSNEFQISILGNFPATEDASLINYLWVQNAMNRRPDPNNKMPICFGIDIGRTHDATVICIRKGYDVLDFKTIRQSDSVECVKEIIRCANQWKPEHIAIDSTGIGAGYYSMLQKVFPFTIGVNFGAGCSNKKFRYKRDQLWWNMREFFQKHPITLPEFPDLESLRLQLSTTRYKDDGDKIKIEPKDKIRQRLSNNSPDHADALAISLEANDFRKQFIDERDLIDPYDIEKELTGKTWMSL